MPRWIPTDKSLVITMVGGNPQHDAFGFRNWNNPGAFHSYLADGTWGNFLGFFSTFVGAAYAYGGPDYIAMTSGEAKYPRRIYPNVFQRVIYRLLVFYIGGVLAVGILVCCNPTIWWSHNADQYLDPL